MICREFYYEDKIGFCKVFVCDQDEISLTWLILYSHARLGRGKKLHLRSLTIFFFFPCTHHAQESGMLQQNLADCPYGDGLLNWHLARVGFSKCLLYRKPLQENLEFRWSPDDGEIDQWGTDAGLFQQIHSLYFSATVSDLVRVWMYLFCVYRPVCLFNCFLLDQY